MANTDSFYIGKRTITSGGKQHSRNKVVTPALMGLTDDQFAVVVKRGGIKKGTPPEATKSAALKKKEADHRKTAEGNGGAVLREDRIYNAIKDLFKEDGSRKSEDDFTAGGQPRTDSLDVIALLEGEGEISAAERDAAWDKYEKEKAAG